MGEENFPKLGSVLRSQFCLEEGTIFTNHGSYGAVPIPVLKVGMRVFLYQYSR